MLKTIIVGKFFPVYDCVGFPSEIGSVIETAMLQIPLSYDDRG